MSTTLFRDTFSGAAANFSARTPDVGTAYTAESGSLAGIAVDGFGNVPSAAAPAPWPASGFATACGTTYTQTIAFTPTAVGTTGSQSFDVGVRTAATDDWQTETLVQYFNFGSGLKWYFRGWAYDPGFDTLFDSGNTDVSAHVTLGAEATLTVEVTPTSVTWKIDGTTIASFAGTPSVIPDSVVFNNSVGSGSTGNTNISSIEVTGPDTGVTIDVPVASLTLTAFTPTIAIFAPADAASSTKPRRPALLLTETLPLRLTTQLGAFAAEQVLPQRYGDLTRTRFRLIRMTATKFFAADHPMPITRAFVGDLETKAFESRTETSGQGDSYAVVEFAAPVPLGTECSASGVGKRNEVTGALIDNPADILADLLALAGRDDQWWWQLRAECSAAGIVLAHSFTSQTTIQDALDVIATSAGAIWCPGMARLYPAAFDGFKIDLDRDSAHGLGVTASLTDTADVLRVRFDYDEVEDRNQSFIQLDASPKRFGGVVVDVELPAVRAAAVAESIGRRLMGWYAGERYTVTFGTARTEFARPGTWARLTSHPAWPFAADPYVMLLRADLDDDRRFASLTGEVVVSTPTVTLTRHSVGSNSIGSGAVEVDVRNGVATFTVFDDAGKPFPGVYASLDGAAPKKTNAQGQVAFTLAQRGQHTLDLSADGFLPQSLVVTL